MTLELLSQTIAYVASAPYFYSLTGMTIASAMFVGATLYNGELKQATKGIVTVGSYAGFLLLMFSTRVIQTLTILEHGSHGHLAWAGTVTIVIATAQYIFGILLGVFVSQQARKKVRLEKLRRENDRTQA